MACSFNVLTDYYAGKCIPGVWIDPLYTKMMGSEGFVMLASWQNEFLYHVAVFTLSLIVYVDSVCHVVRWIEIQN